MMLKPLITAAAILGCFSLFGQNYYMPAPEGFGAATTGGANAVPVIVNNYVDLKAKILDQSTAVILVSGLITIPEGGAISAVISNKSIIGLPGSRLVNTTKTQNGSGILYLKNGSSNVIIRNLVFEGPGAFDIDGRDNLTADGCFNLWVDHCEFQDGLDGNFDIKGNSDNVTVSWCQFTYLKAPTAGGSGGSNDHRFSNLVGSGSSDAPADKHFSVTFQNCYWAAGCRERMPRSRNAELHILNCYYNTDVSSSTALGLGGGVNNLTCYVEQSDFASIGTVYKNYNSSDGGTVDLTFTGCLNAVADVGSAPVPNYSHSLIPAADVATFIPNSNCGAGATLLVTDQGEISSPCTVLSTAQANSSPAINIYPTIVQEILHIAFPAKYESRAVMVSIYSSTGRLVYKESSAVPAGTTLSLNVSRIPNGTYFCRIQDQQFDITRSLIKA